MKKITKVNKHKHNYISVALDVKTARKLKRMDPTRSYAELIRGLINGK